MGKGNPSVNSLIKGIIALPFTALVIIVAIILFLAGSYPIVGPEAHMIVFILGFVPLLAGLTLVKKTITLFFRMGKGTPAPWDPPVNLIKTGIYSRMRNPMITGAILIILAESMIFNSVPLLAYAIIFLFINHVYFIAIEEPRLAIRFGKGYISYKKEVPRWIPKIRK